MSKPRQPVAPAPSVWTYVQLVLTMALWGGTWIAGRVVVMDVSPLAAATWRFALASGALAALVVAGEGRLRLPRGREWALAWGLGLTGIFLYNACFLYGLRHIGAGRGALVVALNPAASALVGWAFFGDRMTLRKAAGILIALFGCLLVLGDGDPARPLRGELGPGEVLILGCVVFWTAYTFLGRAATRTLSPAAATFYGCATGVTLLAAAALLQSPATLVPAYPPRAWASLVFLGVCGTAAGFTWFADGVRRLGAARASAFINLVPVWAVLLGAVMLGERLGAGALAGGTLVLAGVVLTNRGG